MKKGTGVKEIFLRRETKKKPAKGTAQPNEDGEEEKDNENYHRKVRHRPRLNFRLFRLTTVHLIWKKKDERRKKHRKQTNMRQLIWRNKNER